VIPELIGALGVIAAAIITGSFQRMRRENSAAHGRAIQQLDRIASTVEHIDEQVDEIAEWREEHEAFHERIEAGGG